MELTVPHAALVRALRHLVRIVPTRATLPVLQGVLLDATAGALSLRGTNVELGSTTRLPAEVRVPGRSVLPARLLADYMAELPDEPVTLRLDAGAARVRATCGGFSAALATMDPDEFPAFPDPDAGDVVEFAREPLARALQRVAFAAAEDDSRPVLSGVLFDPTPEGLTLAASDGFRLGRSHVSGHVATSRQALIPARAVMEFARLLADEQASARLVIAPDGRAAHLRCGNTTLVARLIEGSFPDISRVIPSETATRVTATVDALRGAVRATGLFGRNGTTRPVMLTAEGGQNQVRVDGQGDETGDAEVALPATIRGAGGAVVLNARLLVDVLDAVATTQVELAWQSPQLPLLVREAGAPDSDDLWLVMPLHDPALLRRAQPVVT